MIRVAVDAPSAVVRAGIEALLGRHEDIEFVDAAPDVLLAVVESAEELAGGTELPTVVLMDEPTSGLIRSSGVRGVLPVDCSAEQLRAAIYAAVAGLVVLHPRELTALPVAEARPPRSASEALTPRETEILTLLADGLSNKEIAARLRISDHTVKFHVASVLGKLGVSTRTEAVTVGLRQGLILL